MHDVTLAASTGVQAIDETLRAIVRAFENTFPSRIRAYYLIGSYVEGTAVPLSDIDCFVIFTDHFVTPQEEALAEEVGQQCASVSSVRLDIGSVAESALDSLSPIIRVALKHGSSLVFGQDIRQSLLLPGFPEYTAAIIDGAQFFIARLRGETSIITQQLNYPDADDEFFGYTSKSIPAWYPPTILAGTKELVATVSRIAAAHVVRQTRQYVSGKQQAITLFQQHIGGAWAPFVEHVYTRCKLAWQYRIPDSLLDRAELRDLCRRMLAFENAFLQS